MAFRVYQEAVAQPSAKRSLAVGVENDLALARYRGRYFDEAMTVIGHPRPLPTTLKIFSAFNYAMAEWAKTGTPPKDMFGRVVELDNAERNRDGANYNQCLVIALWVTGEREAAKQRLLASVAAAGTLKAEREFSCWRYKWIGRDEFLSDCRAIAESMERDDLIPALFLPTPHGR